MIMIVLIDAYKVYVKIPYSTSLYCYRVTRQTTSPFTDSSNKGVYLDVLNIFKKTLRGLGS